jgi:hypothetical protein
MQDERPTERPEASDAPARRIARGDLAIAALLCAATFVIRAVALRHAPDAAWPHALLYEGDAPVWAVWAQHLGRGEPFEFDLAFRTPGVAFLLHWLGLADAPFTGAKMLWGAISAATVGALYLVLVRYFSRRAGAIAATLLALSFGSGVIAASLNNEAPYALLTVLIVGATLAWRELPSWRVAAALGVLHGAAMLLRAEHLLLVALLVPYGLLAARRHGAARTVALTLVLVAALAATIAPWTLRSHRAAHRFNSEAPEVPYDSLWPEWNEGAQAAFEALPAYARGPSLAPINAFLLRERVREVGADEIGRYFEVEWGYTPKPVPEWCIVSFKGPLDFALANHPEADGGFSRRGLADARDPNPPFAFARPTHARLVADGYAVGLDAIRADPSAFGAKLAERLRRFADGAATGLFATDWPYEPSFVRHPIDIATPARDDAPAWRIATLLALGAGAVAAWLRPGGRVLLVVVAYRLAVVLAFYGYARHAVSIAPVLCAMVALAADAATSRLARVPAIAAFGKVAFGATVLAAASLFAIAILAASHPPRFTVRPAESEGVVTPAPQWAPDAIESNDRLLLEPLTGVGAE